MKVLLVNTNQMQPPIAPLGLDYLAEALHAAGLAVEVLDLCFAPDVGAAIRQRLAADNYSLLGLTVRNTDDCYFAGQDFFLPRLRQMVQTIRAHTDAPIVLGGVGFSVMPEAILAYCGGDWGLWGEGEFVLPELVRRLQRGEEVTDLPGLVYPLPASASGSSSPTLMHRNAPAFGDLAALPPMRRRWVDNARYFREGGQGGFETKRGCDQPCIYCADPVAKARRIRLRPPAAVAEEVAALLTQGVDHLHTCDSEFNLPEAHARAVCEELVGRGLGERVRWYAYCAPVPFSDELARWLRRAGCVGVDFGVDSGDDEMLQRLGRPFRSADLLETARICHRQGLTFMYDLLLGGPGETRETLARTIALMRRAAPSRVGLSIGVRLYPYTPLARRVEQEGFTADHPALFGKVEGNETCLAPVFYISPALGEEIFAVVGELVGDDERFFFADPTKPEQNYNYNANEVLQKAIRRGYRGAYWDILRRVQEERGRGKRCSVNQV
ncbi:MAG TPA: radical SAM protein [Armatimonadetes bacterium]|nr:radical SAM protein [Armatimonadota bacterium]